MRRWRVGIEATVFCEVEAGSDEEAETLAQERGEGMFPFLGGGTGGGSHLRPGRGGPGVDGGTGRGGSRVSNGEDAWAAEEARPPLGEERLREAFARIDRVVEDNRDLVRWEAFWQGLLAEYEAVCRRIDKEEP